MLISVRHERAILLRFAGCELDLERFELRRAGELQPMEPQAFDVLAYLLQHHDRMVTREELLDNVWGDRFVSASALSTRIKNARRAVGDDGQRQAVIQTVHGRGFRVVVDVDVQEADPRPTPSPTPLPGRSLPHPTSSFLGREDEVAALAEQIGRSRVVTLCGPGGIGKTRLALAVAARVADRYPEPPRFVELAELAPGTDVVDTLAASTGVQRRAGTDLLDRLVSTFADRHLLLIVDNCEHVADSAAALVRGLVQGGNGIDVIATCRGPLHLDDEQVWPVDPLPVVVDDDESPAVRLFLERAASLAQPSWIDTLDRAKVREVCERVDGVPLCVELAASRARHVGLDGLLDELADSVTLHAVGARAHRHGSIDSVIAWSYDRLSPGLQQLFDRVSVFAGSFDAGAAERVTGDSARRTAAVDGLSELVDQAMIGVDVSAGTARYRLLSPLRDYGRQRLAETGETPAVQLRHARWVIQEATAADLMLRGPGARTAMARFEELLPEMVLAQRTLSGTDAVEASTALSRALFCFGQEQGRVDVLLPLAEGGDAPAAIDGHAGPAIVHASIAVARWQLGDLDSAALHAEMATSTAVEPVDSAIAQLALAEVRQLQGDHTAAIELGASLSRLSEQIGDALLATLAHVVQALSLGALSESVESERQAAIAADIAERCGSPLAVAWGAYALGESRLEHQPEEALAHLERAWSLGRALRSRMLTGVAGLSSVSLRARTESSDGSLSGFAEIIDHWTKAGTSVHQWTTIRNLVPVLAQRGADEESARLYGALQADRRGREPHGAEANRLSMAMSRAEERLGVLRFAELRAEGAAWSDLAVAAYARSLCLEARS